MIKIKLFIITLILGVQAFSQELVNQYDVNGDRTGSWEKRYENGKLRYKGQFIRGKEVGTFYFYKKHYYEHPYLIKTFKKGSNQATVQYYSNFGVLESQGTMNGKLRVGKWLYFDTDGESILLEENYVNGELSGVMKLYYKGGVLTEESMYLNGKLNGSSKRYSSEGKILSNINYKDGVIDGKVFYYENNGILRETGYYANGERVGVWEFYIDGALAGTSQPNKKKEKPKLTLEELNKRKSQKNPKTK